MKKALLMLAAPILLWSCTDNKTESPAAETEEAPAVQKATIVKPDSATAMQNWQAYATPGDMQKMMDSWAGEWTGEASFWMSPDAPATQAKVGATYTTILGGRYSEGIHTGDMMGMPFEGRSMTAYDNARKVFQSTWVDNMGTGMMYLEGTWDEATKTLTSTGKMVLPEMGDGTQTDVKEIIRVEDADHQVMEMYSIDENGKEFKTMEIHSTRKH